ncbi:serine hydrolase domain-containing protein [Streptomyces uncialis]|uniref:serine hydrolase domain-containing protein n=1 Tax=Streptomyces uncialis TaxID=1048205 RepID=UPI0033ED5B88
MNDRSRNALSRRGATRAGVLMLATAGLVGTLAPQAPAASAASATPTAVASGAVASGAPASDAAAPVRTVGVDPAERLRVLRTVVDSGAATWDMARIVEGGRTVWKGAAGTAVRGTGRQVDPDGRFRIGSITKTFTATVVLQLVGEGRMALDEPVETYLPGVLPDGRRITVRQLLNHTSGLYDYTDDPRYVPVDDAGLSRWVRSDRWRTYSAGRMVAEAVGRDPHFPPGQGWRYSNTNYLVAGMLVQRVTGRTWNQEVERRIVRPLGLRDTSMPASSPLIRGPHARNYTRLPSGPVDTTRLNPSVAGAGGAGISSTADLARFHSALFRGTLLRPAELTEMKRTVPTGLGVRYGLGVQRLDSLDGLGCGPLWGHAGGIHGSAANLFGDADGHRQGVTAVSLYGRADTNAIVTRMNEAVACTGKGGGS